MTTEVNSEEIAENAVELTDKMITAKAPVANSIELEELLAEAKIEEDAEDGATLAEVPTEVKSEEIAENAVELTDTMITAKAPVANSIELEELLAEAKIEEDAEDSETLAEVPTEMKSEETAENAGEVAETLSTPAIAEKTTVMADIVEKDFISDVIGDTILDGHDENESLPDANTLLLTMQSDVMPSAIEQALHSDIDNNVVSLSVSAPDNHITVAEQTKIATEDIANQVTTMQPQPSAEPEKSEDSSINLKVNPVVAMGMGKLQNAETSIVLDKQKKSGFKKAAAIKHRQTDEKLPTAREETVDKALISMLNSENNKKRKIKPFIIENEPSVADEPVKYVFLSQNSSLAFSGNVGKNMHAKQYLVSNNGGWHNQYVFDIRNHGASALQGEVGKRILRGRSPILNTSDKTNQYLFASNGKDAVFSGNVSKSLLLGVK
jgi:hypothetical protein